VKVQQFYDALGGIVGYQLKCLELIAAAKSKELEEAEAKANGSADDGADAHTDFLIPQGPNLQGPEGRRVAQRAAADGLRAMPDLAEIYPLGGTIRAEACHSGT
jgi:UTP---glucose-1-phosphate uridylyltransferase